MRLANLEFKTNLFSVYLCRLVLPSGTHKRDNSWSDAFLVQLCNWIGEREEKQPFLWQCMTDRVTNHAYLCSFKCVFSYYYRCI